MHEIQDLERRWLRYTVKKWLPWLALVPVAAVVVFLILSPSEKKVSHPGVSAKEKVEKPDPAPRPDDSLKKQPEKAAVTEQNKTAAPDTAQVAKPEKTQSSDSPLVQTPNLEQSDTSEKKAVVFLSYEEPALSVAEEKAPEKRELIQGASAPESEKIDPVTVEEPSKQQEQKSSGLVTKSDKAFDPEVIERKFNDSRNVKYARFLANYYYDQKQYKKASRWAYTINQLDASLEEGWLLFAKSLYKLGRKQDAVTLLQKYLRHYNSKRAHLLLQKITSGALQ